MYQDTSKKCTPEAYIIYAISFLFQYCKYYPRILTKPWEVNVYCDNSGLISASTTNNHNIT